MLSLRSIAALLVSAAFLTQLHTLDVWISDAVYDVSSKSWAIDHTSSALRYFFYDGPKALLILLVLALIGIVIFSPKRLSRFILRREAIFLLICLAVVPGVVGIIKQNSGVSCPYSIQRYGGNVADSLGDFQTSSYRHRESVVGCWPSGHASGGFALLALAFLSRSRRIRTILALTGLAAGSSMGIYQVLRGAHFPSHILLTLIISLLTIRVVALLYAPLAPEAHDARGSRGISRISAWHRPVWRRSTSNSQRLPLL